MIFPTAPLSTSSMDVRLPTWEVLQETSARLLFMAVRWVRCLVPFQTLSKNDQQLLLQVKCISAFSLNFYQLNFFVLKQDRIVGYFHISNEIFSEQNKFSYDFNTVTHSFFEHYFIEVLCYK